MFRLSSIAVVSAVAAMLAAGPASAQSTAPAAGASKSTSMPAPKSKPRTAVSLECSKQADAKGLHGKARKTFRADCKKHGGKMN